MKKHKGKIILGIIIVIVLAFSFWYGGDSPGLHGWKVQDDSVRGNVSDTVVSTVSEPIAKDVSEKEEAAVKSDASKESTPSEEGISSDAAEPEKASADKGDEQYSIQSGMEIVESTGKDEYLTDPVPEGKPVPTDPQEVVISDKELTCTLSVRCDIILNNIDWLEKEKVEILPEGGIIFEEKTVTFYEGESVFNLLLREMKRNKIHMEFEDTPIYNSAYIEGIANIYEFDCGELSGWMYKVNGWFPNYGSSRYTLKAGDRVEWVYTCDLGRDIGGHYAADGQKRTLK